MRRSNVFLKSALYGSPQCTNNVTVLNHIIEHGWTRSGFRQLLVVYQ